MIKLFNSFRYAGRGIRLGMRESNMRIHLLVSALVILLGFVVALSPLEWGIIVLCIGTVITAELVNTTLEEVCNVIRVQHEAAYALLGVPKDISAAAVLVSALTAALVGLLIFVPHLLRLMNL